MTNLCEMRDRRKLFNTLSLLEAQRSLLQKLSATKEPVPFDFSKFCEFVKQHYPEYYDNVITLVWRRLKECSSFSSNALKNNTLESIELSSDEDAACCTVVVSDDDSDYNRKYTYSYNASSPISKFKFSQFTELESKYSIIRIQHDGSDNDTNESKKNSQLCKEFGQRLSKKKKESKEDIRNYQLLKKSSQKEVNKRKNKSVEDKKTLTSKTKMRETKDRKCKRIKEDKFKIDNTGQKTAKKKRSAKSDQIYNSNCDEGKKKKIKILKEENINKKLKGCRKKILTQMEIERLRNQLLLDKIIEMNLMQ